MFSSPEPTQHSNCRLPSDPDANQAKGCLRWGEAEARVRSMPPSGSLGSPTQLNKLWWGERRQWCVLCRPVALWGPRHNLTSCGGEKPRHASPIWRPAPSDATALPTASGDSGIRTRVQTRNQYAFYTLILALVFVRQQDPSHQLPAYLLSIHTRIAACACYSVNFRAT